MEPSNLETEPAYNVGSFPHDWEEASLGSDDDLFGEGGELSLPSPDENSEAEQAKRGDNREQPTSSSGSTTPAGSGTGQSDTPETEVSEGDIHEPEATFCIEGMPEFCNYRAVTSRSIRLPCRVESDLEKARTLAGHISIHIADKMDDFAMSLEVPRAVSEDLRTELRDFLRSSVYKSLIDEPRLDSAKTKLKLVEASFNLLCGEGWGLKWFGEPTRKLIWPRDSARILVHFARYMNKVVSILKQTNLRKKREARPPKSAFVAGGLPPQQYRGPPASAGGPPFPPRLGTQSGGPATAVPVPAQLPLCLGPAVLVSGHVPSLAPAPTPVPTTADHPEPRPAKRARTSAEAWPSQEEPRFEPAAAPTLPPAAAAGQLLPPERRARLDNLVADTVTRKRKRSVSGPPWVYEVEVPADVALTYNVWVTDKSDGHFLVDGPVVIESTGQELADGGVFAHLEDSFGRRHGYPPRFEISTADGTRAVQSDLEWQQAVLSLYNSARGGGYVFIVVTIYI